MRIWAKLWYNNHMLKDMTVENRSEDTRTHKIMGAIDEVCTAWDLARPIWLDSNIKDFKKHAKTKFNKDSFVETVDFDCLEISVIEED